MKKVLRHYTGIILLIISLSQSLFSEEKKSDKEILDITLGLGIPELCNLGVKFQSEQLQFGLFFGSFPISDETIYSIGGMMDVHFAGNSIYSKRKPWFFELGFNYMRNETEYEIIKYTYFTPAVGYDINLSKELGIALKGGLSIEMTKEEKKIKPDNSLFDFDFDFPVLPSIGFYFYYRIF